MIIKLIILCEHHYSRVMYSHNHNISNYNKKTWCTDKHYSCVFQKPHNCFLQKKHCKMTKTRITMKYNNQPCTTSRDTFTYSAIFLNVIRSSLKSSIWTVSVKFPAQVQYSAMFGSFICQNKLSCDLRQPDNLNYQHQACYWLCHLILAKFPASKSLAIQ